MQKNIDELLLYLSKLKHQPEIIAISEIKLHDNSVHINFQLDGYNFVLIDSPTKVGGVGFFAKNRINFITRDDIELNLPYVEDLWIEIDGKPKMVVGVIYGIQNTQLIKWTNLVKSYMKF